MEYKELQQLAKNLGLPYHGISKEDLAKSIDEAEGNGISEVTKAKEATLKKSNEKSPKIEANTAIVLDGAHEVRRYELVSHGEDFEKLATEFAGDRYTVKLEKVDAGVVCPKCGHEFRPKKAIA